MDRTFNINEYVEKETVFFSVLGLLLIAMHVFFVETVLLAEQNDLIYDKLMDKQCTHKDQIKDVKPSADGCEDCLKTGDSWINLRMCLTCGHVGCCDSSKNTHATKHFHETKHPIMKSVTPGEDFTWCYVDEMVIS